MKSLSALMAAMIVLALITRTYTWKTRALLLVAIVSMLIVLMR